jgi:hypothetical protein
MNGRQMVDADITLRDRIAAVISGVDDWRGVTDPMILADAVIAELNLRIVVDYMSADRQHRNFMLAGNYTTEEVK